MKYCDLTQFYSPVSGGVKRYLYEKINYLRKHAPADSHLLIIPGEKDEQIDTANSRTYVIRSPLISKTSRYRVLLRLRQVEEILDRERPCIIESGDPYHVAWRAIEFGLDREIPVVGFYHSHFPEAYLRSTFKFFGQGVTAAAMDYAQVYVRALYSRFARTMVPSAALERVLNEWGVRNTVNVDLGVDTDIFKTEPDDRALTRKKLAIPPNRRVLLYVGRLAMEKNTRTLFQAFGLLHERWPSRYHLIVIGDGLQRSLLEELKAKTGEITWLSYCSDSEQLARIYRAADLFVHPGVQETFGLVTLESQACGTPVVGIRGSYMDRIIFTCQQPWALENNPPSLAAAICRKFEHDLRELGKEAAKTVAERYSWKVVFGKIFGLYREVIQEHRAKQEL